MEECGRQATLAVTAARARAEHVLLPSPRVPTWAMQGDSDLRVAGLALDAGVSCHENGRGRRPSPSRQQEGPSCRELGAPQPHQPQQRSFPRQKVAEAGTVHPGQLGVKTWVPTPPAQAPPQLPGRERGPVGTEDPQETLLSAA